MGFLRTVHMHVRRVILSMNIRKIKSSKYLLISAAALALLLSLRVFSFATFQSCATATANMTAGNTCLYSPPSGFFTGACLGTTFPPTPPFFIGALPPATIDALYCCCTGANVFLLEHQCTDIIGGLGFSTGCQISKTLVPAPTTINDGGFANPLTVCTSDVCAAAPPPAGNTCDVTSNQYKGLLRSSRRGEATGANNTFSNTISGPGDSAAAWGPSYDSGSSQGSLGIFTYTMAPSLPTATALRFSGSTNASNHAGTVQTSAIVQMHDPTSFPTLVSLPYPNSYDPNFTAQIRLVGITGPDSNAYAVPGSWPMTVISGSYSTASTTFASPVLAPASGWTMLGSGIPALSGPPQPCTGGACDTNQGTVPHPPTVSTNPDYGTNPDQYTPYAVLNTSSNWGFITGRVLDASGSSQPIPGIPVSLADLGNQYPSIEKVTDQNGTYTILLPAAGTISMRFNAFFDATNTFGNTVNSHYFNPHFSPDFATIVSRSVSFASNGTTVAMPDIFLTPTIPATMLTASISGRLTSVESGQDLYGFFVELRDANNYSVAVTSSNNSGTPPGGYQFNNLPPGVYTIVPLLDRQQSSLPPNKTVTLLTGGSVTQNFSLRGVPATVTASAPATYLPGSLVVVASTWVASLGGASTGLPPTIDHTQPLSTASIYTATVGSDNTVSLNVAPGRAYNMICWQLNADGTLTRKPPTGATTLTTPNPGNVAWPTQTYTVNCP